MKTAHLLASNPAAGVDASAGSGKKAKRTGAFARGLLWTAATLGALVLLAVAYLCLWPIPAKPVAWQAPASAGYTGAHAPNTRLAALQEIDLGGEIGPEHIAIGPDGKLYAALEGGGLLRMAPDGTHPEHFANTGGRVLGFDFDASGRMIAADAFKGLLAITPDGRVSVLADRVTPDDPIHYADGIAVADDDVVYFTDAARFAPSEWGGTLEASVYEIMEQSASGRVLAHDLATGRTWVVARGLSMANGLVISSDGLQLFVSETGRYRIWKIEARAVNLDLAVPSPQARLLVENMPGYPDNLMRGQGGRIWVGLFKPRNPAGDAIAAKPFMRSVLLRLPRSTWPVPPAYGHIFAFDEEGRVVDDLQDSTGAHAGFTGATETADRLYIHSLDSHSIGWLPL